MENKQRTMFEIFAHVVPKNDEEECTADPSADTSTQERNKTDDIVYLPIEMLEPYPDHIFRPYSEDKLRELADSILANGILEPVLVRPHMGKYQILAGHNRTNAAKLAGYKEIRCIIREHCNDDDAAFLVADSNINQRENLLPSEKAKAYKIQIDYFNKRGKSVEISGRFPDNEAENKEDSQLGNKTSVYRFIRLTYLVDELLQAVDDDKLALVAGEELSYIDRGEQGCIYQYFFLNNQVVLDIRTAKLLRQRAAATTLTYNEIERLLKKDKKAGTIKAYSIPTKEIQQYIPHGTSKKDAKATIIKALKFYAENYKEG